MPIPADYQDIVNQLVKKTEHGAVYWRQDKFGIRVGFESSQFSLWAGDDEHTGEPFVAFALQDQDGSTIDSWYVEEHEGQDYSVMYQLFTAAKRHAAGVPEKLRALRAKLAEADKIGSPLDHDF